MTNLLLDYILPILALITAILVVIYAPDRTAPGTTGAHTGKKAAADDLMPEAYNHGLANDRSPATGWDPCLGIASLLKENPAPQPVFTTVLPPHRGPALPIRPDGEPM